MDIIGRAIFIASPVPLIGFLFGFVFSSPGAVVGLRRVFPDKLILLIR
jgi:hypothetical protein